jgi:hypothetical protein
MGEFLTTNTTFQDLQDRIPFGRLTNTCLFLGETPWSRPTEKITFFAITQEGVDQSFSSANSTEISIRRFYVQNFITIGLTFEELSCIRPDTQADFIVYSLFEYTKKIGKCIHLYQDLIDQLDTYVSNLGLFMNKKRTINDLQDDDSDLRKR